jgi:hypothetical protein
MEMDLGSPTRSRRNNKMLKKAIQQGPRERSPRNVLQYVRRLSD